MEQCTGDAGGDGEQFPLAGEDLDPGGAGKFGKIHGTAATNAPGGCFVGCNRRKLGEELARVDEERGYGVSASLEFALDVTADVSDRRFLRYACLSLQERQAPVGMTIRYFMNSDPLSLDLLLFNFLDGVGLGDIELGDGGAAQRFEMGSAAKTLTHFVGDGTHVGSRGHAGTEVGAVRLDGRDGEFLYLDFGGLQDNLFLFSCQLVGGDAVDFFGGEWWRDLLDEAPEPRSEILQGF